jgi:hypothetical protein
MNVNDQVFVRDPPPDLSGYCPDCSEPWEYCGCELPSFDDARKTYEEGTMQ